MAEKSLILTIGGIFKGDAFKKARAAVVEMNNDVKKGAGAASQLAAAFGGLDASASKSLQAVAGMAQAIATFNVTAIATQGMMTAINWYFADMKERAEAAAAAAKELKSSVAAAFSNTLSSQITSVNNEVKNLAADFDSITKQANAFTAALEGVRSASAQGGILKLQTEKLQAMMDAHTEAERQAIEAEFNIKIAAQKRIEAEEAGAERIAAATEAMAQNQKRVANIDEQLAKISEERAHLEEALLVERASNGENAAKLETEIAKFKQQEIDLERKRNEALANADVLELNLQKAKQEAANATEAATQGVMAAQLAEQKLSEQKHAREVAEKAAQDAAELDAAAKVQDAQETKSAAEIQAEVNKAAKDLKAAQEDYAAKLREYNSAENLVARASQAQAGKGGLNSQGLLPVDVQKSIQTTVADARVDDAIRNGAVNTVKDMGQLERRAMREARDSISKNQGQQLAEAKRYKRLQEMNPKALASADKEFMQKYEKLLAHQEKQKEELNKAAKAQADAEKRAKETAEAAKNIDKKIDKLVLQ